MTAQNNSGSRNSETMNNENTENKLPVDRHWIQKLLKKHGHDGPALVLAPMVDQSDLPFRLLCRKYGTNLCFTPMIHAKLFATAPKYRKNFQLADIPHDRPLIAQLCGSDLNHMLYTAQAVAPYCDGIDINCGCPQNIARRGLYGAFLLEEQETLLAVVKHLLRHLTVPLSVKVRLLPATTSQQSLQASLALYTKLVDAGIHLLTVHGRTRHHKGPNTGPADWEAIAMVQKTLGDRIPVFANGSLANHNDIQRCLQVTGVDGVMSSEAILEYPPFFYQFKDCTQQHLPTPTINNNKKISKLQLAREYLELCKRYPPKINGQGSGIKCMRVHVHRLLHYDLQVRTDLRARLVQDTNSVEDLLGVVSQFEISHNELSWYYRHRGGEEEEDEDCLDTSGVDNTNNNDIGGRSRVESERIKQEERAQRKEALAQDSGECLMCLFGDE